jgi:hypothetical protein
VDLKTKYSEWPGKLNGTIRPGVPCLWSAGPYLQTQEWKGQVPSERGPGEGNPDQAGIEDCYGFIYQPINGNGKRKQPDYQAWARGEWFPIPLKLPMDEPLEDSEPVKSDDDPSSAVQDPK